MPLANSQDSYDKDNRIDREQVEEYNVDSIIKSRPR
jgi:hypothetical protein